MVVEINGLELNYSSDPRQKVASFPRPQQTPPA